jgi:hypothetical protein
MVSEGVVWNAPRNVPTPVRQNPAATMNDTRGNVPVNVPADNLMAAVPAVDSRPNDATVAELVNQIGMLSLTVHSLVTEVKEIKDTKATIVHVPSVSLIQPALGPLQQPSVMVT